MGIEVNKLKSGMLWSIIEVVFKRSIDFIVKLILARLLFPEDFGVVGMAMVFISFIQVLNDAGMGLAIVQKKELTKKHLDTVFWSNLIWSVFLYLTISFLIAPLAADFYDQQILKEIIPILSLSILMRSLNTVHSAQLKRSLQFKKLAMINNISLLIGGGTAIILALLGFGVWSIVVNTLVIHLISIPLYYNATRWLPTFQWDMLSFKEIMSFGLYTTASQVLLNLVSNADYLLLGKFVGAVAVGTYTIAYMMTNQVSGQISTMVDRVMYPFFSNIQDDLEKLKKYYIKQVSYYVLVLFPIMLTFFLFASEVILLFFGDKWGEAVVPLKILSIAVMINILTSGYNLLFRSIGKPKYEFKIQRLTAIVVYLPTLIMGIYFFGLIGAAVGVLVSRIISFLIHQNALKKYFNIKIKEIFKENTKIIVLCVSFASMVLILRALDVSEVIIITLYIFLFGIAYIILFKNIFIKMLKKSN